MREDYNTYQLIDRYLKNQLSAEESAAFEKRLQSGNTFAEEVNLQKLTNELIVEERFHRVMNEISKPGKGSGSKGKIIIGAIAALLIGGIYLIQTNHTTQKSQKENGNTYSLAKNLEKNKEEKVKKKNPDKRETLKTPLQKQEKIIEEDTITLNSVNKPEKVYSKEPIEISKEVFKEESKIPADKTDKNTILADQIEVVSYKTCAGESTGMIEIPLYSIKGGTAPYLFSLEEEEYQTRNIFENLAAGAYDVKIKDANGFVIIKKNISVGEKTCAVFETYSFNPYYGETWKFPAGDYQDYKVRITNKEGMQVYYMEVRGGSPAEWNGASSNGVGLPTGTYLYTIEFPDGKTNQGSVSIMQ
ncbi:MAG: gliding motility-associated C-terminal domain-containing protein [Cytophagaceae bacterium]|nr:gliding motility-associated C-terminal domain-containing protein [Cytophagaceae bacterium]